MGVEERKRREGNVGRRKYEAKHDPPQWNKAGTDTHENTYQVARMHVASRKQHEAGE